jgi:phage-related protein
MAANSTAIIGRVAVKVSPDTGDFRKDLQRKLNAFEKSLKVSIPTTVNLTGAKRDLIEGVRAINAANRNGNARKITLQTEVSRASLATAAADVEKFRQRVSPIKVQTKVESAPLRKLLGLLGNIGASAAKFAAVASAIGGIAALSLSGASNLAALSASLASLAGLLPVLPGLLGGLAIGLGVSIAALKDFNSVFPDVAASLSAMQDAISAKFWAEAQAPIRHLIDTLLPQLSAGFGQTATALGGYFAGIAAGIKDTLSQALGGMFDDLAKSIEIATRGTDALVGIITTLGQVGAGYLPRLAQWFVDITTRFDEFLSKASADGRLQDWIETGITALRDLGRVLSGIGSIFASIGRAAAEAGGSTLAIFANTLEDIAEIAKGPEFQRGLVQVFEAAHRMFEIISMTSGPALKNFFKELGETVSEILPLAGSAIGTLVREVATALSRPEFTTALIGLFESLRDAVIDLAPAFVPISDALAVLMPIVGQLAEVIAPLATVLFTALAEAMTDMSPLVLDLIDTLGAGLTPVVETLGEVITTVTDFLSETPWPYRRPPRRMRILLGPAVLVPAWCA